MTGSLLAGGLFVVVTDLVARTVAIPIEVPVGLVTAVVGGPFFLWLVHRAARV
jgi:iron complex transport system permease protein